MLKKLCFYITLSFLYLSTTSAHLKKTHETHYRNAFEAFIQRYQKYYETDAIKQKHYQIFKNNLTKISLHNEQNHSFSLAINQFADITSHEFFKNRINALGYQPNPTTHLRGHLRLLNQINFSDLPKEIDWRKRNAVTQIKNQGQCGSCWAFSAIGAIEGAYAIKTGVLKSFSEQELIDCDTKDNACEGGYMNNAFEFAQKGLCSESQYPYDAQEETCELNSCKPIVKVTSYHEIPPKNELALKAAVARQPISVAIEADQSVFQFYNKGVLKSEKCGTNLDHGVTLVGYGEEDGQLYWLVKNSWGETWGDKGYIKIARSESTNSAGECGIALSASYPIVSQIKAHSKPFQTHFLRNNRERNSK